MGILDSVKKKLKAVKEVVSKEVGLLSEAGKEAGANLYEAVNAPENPNETVTDKALSFAKGVGTQFREAQQKYQESGIRNPVLDVMSTLGESPVSIGEGTAKAVDPTKSITQRIEGATQAGLGVVGLGAAPLRYNLIYNVLAPDSVKQFASDAVNTVKDDVATVGKKLGFDEEDSKSAANVLYNVVSILASVAGPKAGKGVTEKLQGKGLSSKVAKAGGFTTDMVVQSSPELIPMVYDYVKNSKDDAELATKTGLVSLAMNASSAIPIKGLRKKIEEGFKEVETPKKTGAEEVILGEPEPVKQQKGKKGKKAVMEEQQVQETKVEQPVEKIPEATTKIKMEEVVPGTLPLTEKVKKGKKAKATTEPVVEAPVETPLTSDIPPEPKTETTPVMETTVETPVPEATTVTEKVKKGKKVKAESLLTPEQQASILEQEKQPEGKKGKEKKQTIPVDTNIEKSVQDAIDSARIIPTAFTLGGNKVTSNIRNVIGRAGKIFSNRLAGDMITAVANGVKIAGSQLVEAIRDPMKGRIIDNLSNQFKLYEAWSPLKDTKVELTPEMLVGKVIPGFFGEKPLTEWAAQKAVDTFNQTSFFDRTQQKGFTREQMANIGKATWAYKFLKGDPERLSQMFTPEQLKALEQDANVNSQRQMKTSEVLSSEEFNKKNNMQGANRYLSQGILTNPNYERTSISPENFQRFLDDFDIDSSKPISMTDENGRVHQFSTALDAYTAYQSGLKDGSKFSEDAFVSFLKNKEDAPVLDLYRDHGSVVSMDSYINNVAQLIANRETLNAIDQAIASKKTDAKSRKYAQDTLLKDDFLMASIDIPQSGKGMGLDTVETLWHKYVTPVTSTVRLVLNPTTYAQAMYSSNTMNVADSLLSIGSNIKDLGFIKGVGKTLSDTVRTGKVIGKSFTAGNLAEASDPFIMNTLAENGFASAPSDIYNAMYEGVGMGKYGKSIKELAQVSAGARIENNTKIDMSLRQMDGFLRSKGIESKNSKDIASNWTKYQTEVFKDPGSPEFAQFVKARANIKMNVATVGDFSKMSRFNAPVIGRFTRDMKSWQVGQISAMIRDATNPDAAAMKRLGVQFAPYALGVYSLYKLYDSQGDEDALEHAIASAESMAFSPAGFFSLVEGALSSSSVGAVANVMNNGVMASMALWEGEPDIAKTELVKMTDLFGGKKLLKGIYGALSLINPDEKYRNFDSELAQFFGTENYKGFTKDKGYAKRTPQTAGEEITNIFIPETYITETLDREWLGRIMDDKDYSNAGSPPWTTIVKKVFTGSEHPIDDILRKWGENFLTPMKDVNSQIEFRKNGLMLKNTMDTVEKAKSLKELVVELGMNPEAEESVLQEILNLQKGISKTNDATKDALQPPETIYFEPTKDPRTDISGYMEELKKGNPYAYNRIMSGFNIASIKSQDKQPYLGGGEETADYRTQADTVNDAFTSNDQGQQFYDMIIADRNNSNALTTSFVNDLFYKLQQKTEYTPVERVNILERFAKEVASKSYNTQLIDSFSENVAKMFSLKDGKISVFGQEVAKDYIVGNIPTLMKFITTGLTLRGETTPNTQAQGLSSTSQTGAPTLQAPTIDTSLSGKIQAMKAGSLKATPAQKSGVSDKGTDRKVRTISEALRQQKNVLSMK